MQGPAYKIIRPVEYQISQFAPALQESAVNVFRMEVDPNDWGENRCAFQWKSPGLNALLSADVALEFDLEISTHHADNPFTFQSASQPAFALTHLGANNTGAFAAAPAKICFAEGNALAQAMQSYQLTVNGAVLSQVRCNEWKASFDKVFYPSIVMERRFGRCGGAFNAYDDRPVSGIAFTTAQTGALAANGANTLATVEAYTVDSGISKRMRGLLACTQYAPTTVHTRIIRVRAPLEGCGIFNFLGRNDECSTACPLQAAGFALPHFNIVNINILWKDLFKTVIRNLTASAEQFPAGNRRSASDITVGFPAAGAKAKICATYIRLPAWRAIPATRSLAAYRVAVHDATATDRQGEVAVAGGCLDGAAGQAIPVVGVDLFNYGAQMTQNAYIDAMWNGVTAAQIPDYIAFVCQKPTSAYTSTVNDHKPTTQLYAANGAATEQLVDSNATQCAAVARNTNGNMAVMALDLRIQSSLGSYTYSSPWPYLKERSELWKDTLKNANRKFCDGQEDIWTRHNSVVFIAASDFARGIGSPGCSLPVVFEAKVRFENRRQFMSGLAAAGCGSQSMAPLQDTLCGLKAKPLMCMLYPRVSLSVSPSSALVSSQNISHASGLQLLSQG